MKKLLTTILAVLMFCLALPAAGGLLGGTAGVLSGSD